MLEPERLDRISTRVVADAKDRSNCIRRRYGLPAIDEENCEDAERLALMLVELLHIIVEPKCLSSVH